ncbi:MAG: LysM peptidoglycan-binding domain-containing protein [Kiritimatiellaeota bacterium]|nr:LysM peptidoglycan-binding domain-containing protein [Kiritimatiellota bacterium]
MMKNLFLLLPVWVFFAGCRPDVGAREARERGLPLMRQAIEAERLGDLDKAAALYADSLMADPSAASAHLGLAIVLHEHAQDFLGAAYHYQRYLDLRPGSEKEEMVRGRVTLSEQLLTQQLVRRHGDAAGVVQQQQDKSIRALKAAAASNEVEMAVLKNENTTLRETVKTQAAEIERQKRLLDRVTAPGAAPAPRQNTSPRRTEVPDISNERTPRRPAVPTLPAGGPAQPSLEPQGGGQGTARPTTHTVQIGETLTRIAERHYGDPKKWTTIRDANKETIGDDGQIRAGQVLTIPPAERPGP